MSERLLKEYVREVLREDDTAAVWGDLHTHDMMMHPYGARFGSANDLYKIFIKPFVDVVDTTMGKTKELSQHAQTLVKVAFETIATTLVPIFSDSYKEIFAAEKKSIDKIRNDYKDVYQSNWDAFRDNDAFWTAFCYAPWAIMTIKLIKQTPKTAARLASTLSGGSADRVLSRMLGDWNRGYGNPKSGLGYANRSTMGMSYGDYGGNGGSGGGGAGYMEGVIREDEDSKQKKHGKKDEERLDHAAKVLTSPKFIAMLRNSDVVKGMEKSARDAVRNTLHKVYVEAQAVMRAKSLQELQQKTGKQVKGLEKLREVPQAERQKAEQALLAGLRKTMKNFYTENLDGQVKDALKAGVPENSPYISDYRSIIAKIKAL